MTVAWQPYPHQEELAREALGILQTYGLAYIAAQERSGKSLSALLVYEQMPSVDRVLIVTTKKAIKGWEETLSGCAQWLSKDYDVINYHSAHKMKGNSYDAVILDEAHSYISSYPKRAKIWSSVKPFCLGKPILYLSATPHAHTSP